VIGVEADDSRHVCEFCKASFAKEDTLLTHVCEKKRRFLQREEKPVKLGFLAFQRFYQRGMGRAKPPSIEVFERSNFYIAFVKFGRWLHENSALNPLGYVDFLLRTEVPIDKWQNPALYETYVRELNKGETPVEALERNIMLMQQWSVETGEHWTDFFRKVAPPLAALWIRSGRISPWVLFTAPSARDLLGRLSPEQTAMVEQAIDPHFWRIKLARHAEEVAQIRAVLAEAGV